MAGAGYKLFNTGDVLTAAQVNTYLQEQTVMVFASSAARTSALSGVLAEGMVSYLQDTNAVEVYNGTAWVGVSGAGDVTEVQAGTGISVASGTGPIPVVTNTMATEITAKGDLIVGTGSGTFDNLPAGTNGFVLQADSSTATGLAYAAPSSGSMTQLATGSFSGTNLQLTGISTAYKDLRLVIQDWYMATDNNLFIQLNNVTTGSYQNIFFRTGTTTVTTDLANSSGYIGVAEQDASDGTSFAMLTIFDYANTNTSKLCQGIGYSFTGAGAHSVGYSMTAMTSGTAAVTEIDIFGSGSPTLTQGTYFLYGVK